MKPVVLFDVDCTIVCGCLGETRPGLLEFMWLLSFLGFEINLWSAGGSDHAAKVAKRFGFEPIVWLTFTKPDYPMTLKTVEAVLQFSDVALQVDDDESEHVEPWPFVAVEPFWCDECLHPKGLIIPKGEW